MASKPGKRGERVTAVQVRGYRPAGYASGGENRRQGGGGHTRPAGPGEFIKKVAKAIGVGNGTVSRDQGGDGGLIGLGLG